MSNRLFSLVRACLITIVVAATSSACSDKDGGDSGALGIDDGASVGESTAMLVTSDKAAVLTLTTGARLMVPMGAVDRNTEIVMKRPPDRDAKQLVKNLGPGQRLSSAPYVLTPHGTSFLKDVDLTLPIARGSPERLKVAWLTHEQDTDWKVISAPKTAGNTATISLQHFSVLVLFEDLEGEPEMDGGIPDASSDSGQASEASPADAGAIVDSGGPDVSPDGSIVQLVRTRLEACGLVTQPGEFLPNIDETEIESEFRCEVNCWTIAPCLEFLAYTGFCGEREDEPQPSAEVQRCFEACLGHPYYLSCMDFEGAPIMAHVCDTYAECADGADERDCPADTYFICGDGARVPGYARCDAYADCQDGTDELDCPASTFFMCTSGERIAREDECDGFRNCEDGSDELNCAGRRFDCADQSASISLSEVCDFELHCEDGSDESARCLKLDCSGLSGSADASTPPVTTAKDAERLASPQLREAMRATNGARSLFSP